jgi:hypothetical protein
VVPKAGRAAGKIGWKLGKGQAKLVRQAASSREPRGLRFLKYGFFALAGLAIGALVSRSGRDGASSSFTGTTGQHSPDAGSPAGQRGETWGSGTPTGTAGGGAQHPEDPNRTGAERGYSDPSSGPLIGEQHRGDIEGVPEQQEEVEQRIRTSLGEDPRTADMPRERRGQRWRRRAAGYSILRGRQDGCRRDHLQRRGRARGAQPYNRQLAS